MGDIKPMLCKLNRIGIVSENSTSYKSKNITDIMEFTDTFRYCCVVDLKPHSKAVLVYLLFTTLLDINPK